MEISWQFCFEYNSKKQKMFHSYTKALCQTSIISAIFSSFYLTVLSSHKCIS